MLQQRIGNAIYDRCRAQTLVLPGFPQYDPLVASLKENAPAGGDVSYKVCVVRHDCLLVLQSLTRRWLEYEGTKDAAHEMVEAHNKSFNQGGEFMEYDERTFESILMADSNPWYGWKQFTIMLNVKFSIPVTHCSSFPFPSFPLNASGCCAPTGLPKMIMIVLQRRSNSSSQTHALRRM